MHKPHKNKLLRIQRVLEITRQHYEEGNLAKCYKMVWRRYVYPIYPMCYHTYLSYLRVGLENFREPEDERQSALPGLFDEKEPPTE